MHEQPQIPQYKLTLNLASVGFCESPIRATVAPTEKSPPGARCCPRAACRAGASPSQKMHPGDAVSFCWRYPSRLGGSLFRSMNPVCATRQVSRGGSWFPG